MSPYRAVANTLGLSVESGTSQNFHWVYLFLSALADLDDDNPADITYSDDDAKEVLHRLRLRGYRGFAAQEMERLLSPRVK